MVSQCQAGPMYPHNSMQSVEKRRCLGLRACANLVIVTLKLAVNRYGGELKSIVELLFNACHHLAAESSRRSRWPIAGGSGAWYC